MYGLSLVAESYVASSLVLEPTRHRIQLIPVATLADVQPTETCRQLKNINSHPADELHSAVFATFTRAPDCFLAVGKGGGVGDGGAVTFSVRTCRKEVELVRRCPGMYGHLVRPN